MYAYCLVPLYTRSETHYVQGSENGLKYLLLKLFSYTFQTCNIGVLLLILLFYHLGLHQLFEFVKYFLKYSLHRASQNIVIPVFFNCW